jgi:hypothetical protein
MRTDVSITDRIGNGIVAGFIATLVLSALHDPVSLLAEVAGIEQPVPGLLFHFFVGTLLWGGTFGVMHDYLYGPSWVRGITFAAICYLIIALGVMPAVGAGLFGIGIDIVVPFMVAVFHLLYGAMIGVIYGKLIDTDEARAAEHAHR